MSPRRRQSHDHKLGSSARASTWASAAAAPACSRSTAGRWRAVMERSILLILQWDENFDIGADTGTLESNDYQVPFKFAGKLDKPTLTIGPVEAVAGGYQKAG